MKSIPHEKIRKKEDRSWTFRLLDTIQKSNSTSEVKEACETIGKLHDPRSIEPLIQLLEDTSLPNFVRQQVSNLLTYCCIARCEADRRAWWHSGDKILMTHAIHEARTSDADIVIPIASDPLHEFHYDAICSIEFGFEEPEYQRLLIQALSHPNSDVRDSAAGGLTWSEPVEAEDGLIACVTDSDEEVSQTAVTTLSYFRSQKVFQALNNILRTGSESLRNELRPAIADQREDFESTFHYLKGESQEFFHTWLKPIEHLISLKQQLPAENANEETTPKHPPKRRKKETVLRTAKQFIDYFDDQDGCWARKGRGHVVCDWKTFSEDDQAVLSEYFRDHSDNGMREFGCEPLGLWKRADILETFLHDACSGVKRNAAFRLISVAPDPALAQSLWNVYQDVNSTGNAAKYSLQAYVVHAQVEGLEDLLADIVQSDRRMSRKAAALSELKKLNAHSHLREILSLLGEPPLLNWSLHRDLVVYCVEQKLSVPFFSDLCRVDDLRLQQSLAEAVVFLKPVLLKGLSYAARE